MKLYVLDSFCSVLCHAMHFASPLPEAVFFIFFLSAAILFIFHIFATVILLNEISNHAILEIGTSVSHYEEYKLIASTICRQDKADGILKDEVKWTLIQTISVELDHLVGWEHLGKSKIELSQIQRFASVNTEQQFSLGMLGMHLGKQRL